MRRVKAETRGGKKQLSLMHVPHGDKIRETPARAQCKGNQWDAGESRTGKKKRFSDVLNLFGGVRIFFYVVGVLNSIVHVNQYVERDKMIFLAMSFSLLLCMLITPCQMIATNTTKLSYIYVLCVTL
jgi:hypothetical protein